MPTRAPFVLPEDEPHIRSFNSSEQDDRFRIHLEVPPEPFVGRPTAPVIVLNLNPGFEGTEEDSFQDQDFFRAHLANLAHDREEWPFLWLDPRFPDNSGYRWWTKKLGPLILAVGQEQVAANLCCVEWFGYHSRKFKQLSQLLPSQQYGFGMVELAVERGAVIVVLWGEGNFRRWVQAVPTLEAYGRLFRLNSWQNPTISPNNCPGGWVSIVEALRQT